MKRTILILAIVLSVVNLFGQNISGQWNGLLSMHGRELRIVFNITKTSNGYRATMDSPDQGASRLRVNITSFKDSILTLYIANNGIEYLADLSKENTFIGMLKQANELFPLVLSKQQSKNADKVAVKKPEMNAGANSEAVSLENKELLHELFADSIKYKVLVDE